MDASGAYIPDPMLATGVEIPVRFQYLALKDPMPRSVVLRDLFGWSFEGPTYVRGLDLDAGAPRSFKVSRMTRVYTLDGEGTADSLGWLIGQMFRQRLGLGLRRPPLSLVLDRAAVLMVATGADLANVELVIRRADFGYLNGDPQLSIAGHDAIGKVRTYWCSRRTSRPVVGLRDAETGVEHLQMIPWLVSHGQQVWD